MLGFGGFEFVIFPLLVVGLLVVVASAVAGGRSDPDPTGQRPYAIYLTVVVVLALFTLLFATTSAVTEIARAVDSNLNDDRLPPRAVSYPSGDCARSSSGVRCVSGTSSISEVMLDEDGREVNVKTIEPGVVEPFPAFAELPDMRRAIPPGLLALAAAAVLWFHRRRLRILVAVVGPHAPVLRSYRASVYLTIAAALFTAVTAFVGSGSNLYEVIDEVVFDPVFHRSPEVGLFENLVLLAGAGSILRLYWRRAEVIRNRGAEPETGDPED